MIFLEILLKGVFFKTLLINSDNILKKGKNFKY